MVCKQYIILNHVLSEKTASFPQPFPARFPTAFPAAFPTTFPTAFPAAGGSKLQFSGSYV